MFNCQYWPVNPLSGSGFDEMFNSKTKNQPVAMPTVPLSAILALIRAPPRQELFTNWKPLIHAIQLMSNYNLYHNHLTICRHIFHAYSLKHHPAKLAPRKSHSKQKDNIAPVSGAQFVHIYKYRFHDLQEKFFNRSGIGEIDSLLMGRGLPASMPANGKVGFLRLMLRCLLGQRPHTCLCPGSGFRERQDQTPRGGTE